MNRNVQSRYPRLCAIALVTALLFGTTAVARVTRVQITTVELVAGGMEFGRAGAYEKVRGTVFFEVNPADPHNAVVFDIDKAPRNARGNVEFSADFYVLRPVDLARGNHELFFEVNNRGNKTLGALLDLTATANANDPTTPIDFGNGFLLRRGYVIAWVGWGADIAPGNNRLTVSFPVAMQGGQPITERILTEFSDRNFGGGTPFTLPLSGGTAFKSYESVSTNPALAEAELRVRPSDSPRPSSPDIPGGEVVPTSQWSFANCPAGPPGTPSVTDICLAGGFQNDKVYQLVYRATKSPIMGLGYVTMRDWVSFLRHQEGNGPGVPTLPGRIDAAICQGISSSGMYMRDYLYQGFNEDEQGRRVCDGVTIHIPGVQKLFLNYRFAQPNPFTVQHRERYVPDDNFPRSYGLREDPLSGAVDGILKRPDTDPKVIHTDSGTEHWQFRSSLVDTDEDGTVDIEQQPNVRRYLFSSTQHGATKGAQPTHGIADRQCQQLNNQTHSGALARALEVALDDWVHGIEAPGSRVPRIDDGTLISPDVYCSQFPAIPGVNCTGLYNGSGERDFGPRVAGNSGVIDKLLPDVLSVHTVLVPAVDQIGNDLAGVRHPFVEAPIATLTGWGLRTAEFGPEGDLCDLNGQTIPLFRTQQEREEAGDPRASLEELYGDHRGYVTAVAQAALNLYAQRLLLLEDVERIIQEADDSNVLR